jgi:hypothetical protein
LANLTDARVAWASFAIPDQAIDELLADPQEVIAEREAFLLRNLELMLQEEDLLKSFADVVYVLLSRLRQAKQTSDLCEPEMPSMSA